MSIELEADDIDMNFVYTEKEQGNRKLEVNDLCKGNETVNINRLREECVFCQEINPMKLLEV